MAKSLVNTHSWPVLIANFSEWANLRAPGGKEQGRDAETVLELVGRAIRPGGAGDRNCAPGTGLFGRAGRHATLGAGDGPVRRAH